MNGNDGQAPVAARLAAARDCMLVVLALCAGGGLVWHLTGTTPFIHRQDEIWFDSDPQRVYESMTKRWTPAHARASVHPLFPLTTVPAVYVMTRIFGIEEVVAVRLMLTIAGAIWCALLYQTLRLTGRTAFDSALFTGLGLGSAAGMFFLSIPETYVFGSISILACLAATLGYERGLLKSYWVWIAAASTMAMTITNYLTGVASLVVLFGWKAGTQKSVNAYCLISVLCLF